jgi:hypothetical protein
VLDEVGDDDSDDFADFDDDEDALNPADEQRALVASFGTTHHDQAVQQFMVAEHQAHQEVRDMWQCTTRSPARTRISWPG